MLRIVDLASEEACERTCFGGKAAGLARLAAIGARVPEGFAMEATRVEPRRWDATLRGAFRERVTALLADGPVAVRSSALPEDGGERSFAGIFETVLGVGSPADALEAAAHCIASGDATRLYAYAGPTEPVRVGLVVQRQVRARAAGVCFTRDPLGRDDAVLIEAVSGCGDALVSGHAQPECWRIAQGRRGPDVLREAGDPAEAVLKRAEACEIAREARVLAERLGEPLDLEWARDDGGRLWWLQARPVTTGAVCPVAVERTSPEADDGPVTVWSNFNLRETLPDPLPPLVWSLWRDRLIGVLLRAFVPSSAPEAVRRQLVCVDRVAGRIYWNLNAMLAVPVFGPMLGALADQLDPDVARILAVLRSEGVLRRRRVPGRGRVVLSALLELLRGLTGLRESPEEGLGALRRQAFALRHEARPLSERSHEELLAEILRLTDPDLLGLHRQMVPALVSTLVFQLASRAFRRHPEAARRLAVGIRGNPTTEMSLGLESLAKAAGPVADLFQRLRARGALLAALAERPEGRVFLARLDAFLAENGQRGPKEFDLSVPRWSEQPDLVLGVVRAGLREPAKEPLRERMARLGRERRDAIAVAVLASPAWQRPLQRWLARAVERWMPFREAPKHYGLVVFQRVREILLEIGARLAAGGRLATRDDVFYLEWHELEEQGRASAAATDWRAVVLERRTELARLCAEPAPAIVRSDGRSLPEVETPAEGDEPGVLRGTGIATGRATGRVRILHAPDAGALEPGDVLVVRFADPGWTPLFPRAGALVMEVGGLMCHAAVVARELGLPAVFGVRDATRRLAEGTVVTVDGLDGSVRPH